MNNIDFNQTGGFPLSTQILAAQQEAYRVFNQLGYLAGSDLVILTGCEVGAGGSVTNGFVHIGGEVLPFVGTTVTEKVIIVETQDSRGFEDGSVKPVIYTRYATFGAGGTEYTWTDFRRPKTLFQLEDRLLQLEKSVPIGLVAIWDRPADEIPEGWEEHADLKGKVPAGYLSGDVNFGALGSNIGAAQVTLSQNELPKIEGVIETLTGNAVSPSGAFGYTYSNTAYIGGGSASTFSHKGVKMSFGNNAAHTNIQPSRIVKFIRFVGF